MVTARCDGLAVMPRQPVGVLILRIWLEPDSPTPFRATIRMTADVGFGPPVSVSVSESGAVIDAVRGFLDQMAGGHDMQK